MLKIQDKIARRSKGDRATPAAKMKVAKTAPATTPAAPTPETPAGSATPKGKLGALVALLTRDGGARIDELTAATGWQAHSVRGAMSGSLKKKLGLTITSEKSEGGRVYKIAPEPQA